MLDVIEASGLRPHTTMYSSVLISIAKGGSVNTTIKFRKDCFLQVYFEEFLICLAKTFNFIMCPCVPEAESLQRKMYIGT